MSDLKREPNPQPLPPVPQGVVSQKVKLKGATAIAVAGGFIAIAAWLFWPHAKAPVMGPKGVATVPVTTQTTPASFSIDMEREKAYEEGKREAETKLGGLMNAQNMGTQPAPYYAPASAPVAPTVPTPVFTGNMVKGETGNDNFRRDNAVGNANGDYPLPTMGVGNNSAITNAAAGGVQEGQGGRDQTVKTVSENVLPEGTLVFGTIANALNGDNVGPVKVLVSQNVYFPDSRTVAIPQGAVIIGEAQKVGQQFQQRLAVSFHSLQIGNRQISLDKMPGLDQEGAVAIHDKVNNHYAQIFGASLAIGAIGGLAQIGQGSYGGLQGYDTSTQIRNGISQSTAQSSAAILSHFLQRPPTLTVRAGTRIVVWLTGNVSL